MKKSAYIIVILSIFLCVIGSIFVMSASSTYSGVKFESLFHMFNVHVVRVLLGLIFLVGFAFIPYDAYKHISKPLIIAAMLLLIYTLAFAEMKNGSGRWINLFGIISFQPSDLARLFLIIHLAALIERKGELIQDSKVLFIHLFFWVAVIAGLIFAQPNVSNAVIIVLVTMAMFFVGGAKPKHIFLTLAGSFFIASSFAMIITHSRLRIISFVKALILGKEINQQVYQAFLALGSGGLFGLGLGNSEQSNLFLPESYGDFIFAIIGEETGFVGAVVVISSYFLIFFFGLLIAKKARDTFGQLLAFGISFSILLNAFINIAVAVGMTPTTGIPLPFISYGGTSILITCSAVGILVNIAVMNARFESKAMRLDLSNAEQPV